MCSGLIGRILVEGNHPAGKLIPMGLFELTALERETQELSPGRDAGKEQCLLCQWSQGCSPPFFLVLEHDSHR